MAHPPGDCEDCGRYHIPWSIHERDRLRRIDTAGDAVLLKAALVAVLAEWKDADPLIIEDVLTDLSMNIKGDQ